jgi:type II secretory pathway component PulF
VSALWGVWGIIQAVLNLGWLSVWPLWWITWLADSVLLFSLGLLLGVGILKTFIKNPQAQAKMDQTITKLAPKQGVLGLIAIGVGIWMVLGSFILL